MKPMRFEYVPAWESVTTAIYNPDGNSGKLFWNKLSAYKQGDEMAEVVNGYQYQNTDRFPFIYVKQEKVEAKE